MRTPSPRLRARFAVALSIVTTALCAFGAAPAAAQESLPSTNACDLDTMKALILDRQPEFEAIWMPSPFLKQPKDFQPLTVRCLKIDGDDIPDALWLLNTGGSSGPFQGGVALSGNAERPASLEYWIDQPRLTVGTYKGRPAIAWPVFRKKDPMCCPRGGWRWRYYSARPDGSVKQSKLRSTKQRKSPLKKLKK